MKVSILCAYPRAKFIPLAWAIKKAQGVDYSHMAIAVGNDVLDVTLFSGVEFHSIYWFSEKYKIVREYVVDVEAPLHSFYKWAWTYRRASYSVLQNLGILLSDLKLIKKNPFGFDGKHLNCSELCALFLRDFKQVAIDDSDEYDLVKTELLLKEHCDACHTR